MILSVLAILAGFALLIWGADKFVIGASGTAASFGVSPLIIGLTIVGFGTSAPEMLVSLMAALHGNPEVGVGNAIGSNITNIGLVLGFSALIVPLRVTSSLLKREYPIMMAVMLLGAVLILDNRLSRMDGMILLLVMFLTLGLITWLAIHDKKKNDILEAEFREEIPKDMSSLTALGWLIGGFVVLLISSRMLVWGAVTIAHTFGVSDLVIGLTIIAIGTSLPELAATLASALKGEHDIAIGNIIGSNIFNLLGVLGIPAVIEPIYPLSVSVLQRDYPVMALLSILFLIFGYGFKSEGRIQRLEGGILLAAYLVYLYFIYTQSIAVIAG